MGDYWDHLLERVTGHSDYFQSVSAMVPLQVISPQQIHTMPYARKETITKPSIQVLQSLQKEKLLKKFDPTHKREDEQKDELNEEDSKVEIIPGFSNEILDSKELNKRFQEKLAALRSKRKLADEDTEDAERAKKRRKIEKQNERKDKKQRRKNSKPKAGPSVPKDGVPRPANGRAPEDKKDKDNLKSLEFASFDMSGGAPVPLYLQQRKKRASSSVLLQQAQEHREKMEALKGTEEGKKVASEHAWDTMFKKAQGEKVKDDINKLKKTVKREQAQKKKSQKDWAARISAQKKSQAEAQIKRQKNIDARKQQKKDRRMGVKASRPGFEGKKHQYINKK